MRRKKKQARPNTCIIYCRKSTDRQEVTLQDQEAKMRLYFTAKNIDVVEVISEEVSATVPLEKRAGGARLLAMVASGKVGHVGAMKLDRLFRRSKDCAIMVEDWDDEGVGLHITDLNLDTTTVVGEFFVQVLGAIAQLEQKTIAERTRNGIAYRREHRMVYNKPAYGWEHVDGRMVENKQEQAVIRRIRKLRAKDKPTPYRAIADTLNKSGIKSKTNKAWSASAVHFLLHNEINNDTKP